MQIFFGFFFGGMHIFWVVFFRRTLHVYTTHLSSSSIHLPPPVMPYHLLFFIPCKRARRLARSNGFLLPATGAAGAAGAAAAVVVVDGAVGTVAFGVMLLDDDDDNNVST